MNSAYGFLEVRGLVAGIESADVMLKAANVRLATQITTNPALITLIVGGDIGSCRAAIDAGRLAAERLGAFVSEKVIGRPEPDLALFVNAQQRWKNSPSQPKPITAPSDKDTGTTDTSVDLVENAQAPELPAQPEVSAASSAHAAADLGSDPNSANATPPEAQPNPELGSDPNSADQDAEPAGNKTIDQDSEPKDPLAQILTYLAAAPNGKRLDQIAALLQQPESALLPLLTAAIEVGRLKKSGSRYLIQPLV